MDTLIMVMPPRRRAQRRRQSLQDRSALSPAPRPTEPRNPKRRIDRFSTGTRSQQSLELSLLQHVQVEFVKAMVSGAKLARPRYVLKITNTALGQSWEMARPFSDFWDLKEQLLSVLERGHVCASNCPWLYVFIAHNFPRRHWLRSRRSSVISSRLTELQSFVTTMLKVIKEQQRPVECAIASEVLPRLLYDFLFEGMIFNASDFEHSTLLDDHRLSMTNRNSDDTSCMHELCPICEGALRCKEPELTVAKVLHASTGTPPESSTSTLSSSEPDSFISSSETMMAALHRHPSNAELQSITTLECGHKFHDECILYKLNQDLNCPVCASWTAH